MIDLGKPNAKQSLFLMAREHDVCYGGARGGGKSWVVRTKAVLLASLYKGIKILIVRRTFPELLHNHINPLTEKTHGLAKYNKQEKILTFPGGSKIVFGYCATVADMQQYQGQEYDIVFLEEAAQLTEEQMVMFRACVRGANNFPKRIYYTCNPGGPGHQYIKRLFIDRKYKEKENPADYRFIQALPQDNTALMALQPDYIAQLEMLPPKLRDAWLYGSWDVYEGQFFEDFVPVGTEEERLEHKWTHVIKGFDPPAGWTIHRSYDFGYSKPFSCAWWAVDYEGTLYRILELYGCRVDPNTREQIPNEGLKWTADQQFREIARIEREHPWLKGREITGVADPSIWDASRGESVAETAAKHGVYFSPGDNERIAGWMQVHYRFQFDDNGYPRMYIFDNCKAFIRTMPLLMYSEHKPEDLDTEGENHVADEVRYMCMSRPVQPIEVRPKRIIYNDPLDQFNTSAERPQYIFQ